MWHELYHGEPKPYVPTAEEAARFRDSDADHSPGEVPPAATRAEPKLTPVAEEEKREGEEEAAAEVRDSFGWKLATRAQMRPTLRACLKGTQLAV
jgi:hypothetical protein